MSEQRDRKKKKSREKRKKEVRSGTGGKGIKDRIGREKKGMEMRRKK